MVQQALSIFERLEQRDIRPSTTTERVAAMMALFYFRGYFERDGLSPQETERKAREWANQCYLGFLDDARDVMGLLSKDR